MSAGRLLAAGLWALAAALGLATAWQFMSYGIAATLFPAALNIGEGVVLHQAMFRLGHGMYGDISHYPYMVFEYPPLYLLACRALAAAGFDLLVSGRVISLVSTVFCSVVLAVLVRKCTPTPKIGWAGGSIAAILPWTTLPVIVWVPLMRVDMLGMALTLAGLVLVIESNRFRFLLVPAMIAFVAAVFTRQTYIAAPVAALSINLLRAPRRTMLATMFGLALGIGALIWLDWQTQGGFYRHVVVYLGKNAFDLRSAFAQIGWWTLRYCTFWLVALAGLVAAWRARADLGTNDRAAVLATMAVYLAITTVMTLLIGKSGAWLNYLIEWILAGSFWAGFACIPALAHLTQTTRRLPLAALAIPLLLALQLANGPLSLGAWRAQHLTPARVAENAALVDTLKKLPEPILSDDMVALWQAGKDPGLETFMFAEMSRTGMLPESALVSMLRQKAFSAVVTEGAPGDSSFDTRYLPATQGALRDDYDCGKDFGRFRLCLPKKE